MEAKLWMQMRYETAFGIYDHNAPDDPQVPWPLMAVSIKEDLSRVDLLKLRLDQHAEYKVFEIFGLSFDTFIQLPRRDLLMVLESAKKHAAMANRVGNDMFSKLEAMMKKNGSAY